MLMLGKIGISLGLLITQIVNFLVMLFVLQKFLYKPLLKILNKRKKEIREGLLLKEKLQQEREKIEEEKERILAEAREEAQILIERKKKDANKIKDRIIAEAREEKEKITKQAEKEIEAKRAQMEKTVRKEAVDLAALMAEKVLKNLLSDKSQHQIIRTELDKISKVNKNKQ